MKILFVLENYIPHIGGVEIVFKELCERLAKLGHKISVITHQIKGTRRFERIGKVDVYRIPCLHSRYLFTFLAIPKVLKIAKEADIIHTTTFNGAFPAWLVSKILKKPSLITVHEVWIGKWGKLTEMNFFNALFHDILERMIYLLRFDSYVCVSESTKKQLLEIKKKELDKIKVVYNGIDYKFWDPKRYDGKKIRQKFKLENNFVYMFYGRPGISKGLEHLIRAVPYISNRIPNSKLLAIVSKDKAYKKRREEIISLIKKINITDKVIFLDPVPREELPDYIKSADCIAVPSLAEGFGFTVVESCAMKRPIVASDTTSLPEIISGEHALVERADPKSIAEGIEKVYIKKAKKTPIIRFKIEDNIEGYIKEYRKLIKNE